MRQGLTARCAGVKYRNKVCPSIEVWHWSTLPWFFKGLFNAVIDNNDNLTHFSWYSSRKDANICNTRNCSLRACLTKKISLFASNQYKCNMKTFNKHFYWPYFEMFNLFESNRHRNPEIKLSTQFNKLVAQNSGFLFLGIKRLSVLNTVYTVYPFFIVHTVLETIWWHTSALYMQDKICQHAS